MKTKQEIKIITLFTLFNIIFSVTNAQSYLSLNIPDSLKKNAATIILKSKDDINLEQNKIIHSVYKEFAIITTAGIKYTKLEIDYDKFSKIKNIQYEVLDASGNSIKVIKPKEIFDYSDFSSSSFYSDNRIKFIDKQNYKPPFVVRYSYTIEYYQSLFLPVWIPQEDFDIAVLKAEMNIKTTNFKYKTIENNFFGEKSENFENGVTINKWKVSNLKAAKEEKFKTDVNSYFTIVRVIPKTFAMEGYVGKTSSWNEFGKWVYSLNTGRDILPLETVEKVKTITKDVESPKEKAKIIYEYMQKKTRYVSVQIGIGGWQPFSAEEVDRSGYGDCKALSNYTMALLNAVGIKSYYTIVKAGEDYNEIDTQNVFSQFNHAILCVPFENDTVWLECTSQTVPFGYQGSFTDNRNVLLIDENGGKIVKTHKYESNNIKKSNSEFNIDEYGNLTGKTEITYNGLWFDGVYFIENFTPDNQKKHIMEEFNIPGLTLNSFDFNFNKSENPSVTQKNDITVKNYASVSPTRIFISPDIYKNKINKPEKIDNRTKDFEFKRTYTTIDTATIYLPLNFICETNIENKEITNKFGYYSVNIKIQNNIIYFKRQLTLNKGEFTAKDYTDLYNFFTEINSIDNRKIVFLKQ
jgi:hypothetical protein